MHEHALPDTSTAAVADGARAVGTFVKNAAVSVVEGVEHDGAALVRKDVGLGARAEAGLNVAADVASVVTGPEDIAAERAAVIAVKEGIEHAPQIAEGAIVLGKAAAREVPEIAKSATGVFDKAASIIKAAGHEILDSQPGRGLLETKHTIYSVAEHTGLHLGQIGELFNRAGETGKNFAVHGPNLANSAVNELEKLGYERIAKHDGIETFISRSEQNLEHALARLEKSHAMSHALGKTKDVVKSVTDALETTGKVGEYAKKGLELAGYGSTVALIVEHAGHVAHDAVDAAKTGIHRAETAIGRAKQQVSEIAGHAAIAASTEVGHATAEAGHIADGAKAGIGVTGKALEQAGKGISDCVQRWTPEMPMEDFHKLLATIRGGTPAHVNSQEAPSRNHVQRQDHGLGH